jgi:hypothetical protein
MAALATKSAAVIGVPGPVKVIVMAYPRHEGSPRARTGRAVFVSWK